MANYTTVNDPSPYFGTTLYTGNQGTITLTRDDIGWLWVKRRGSDIRHCLFDNVRGGHYTGSGYKPVLVSDSNAASQGTDINTAAKGVAFASAQTVIGNDAAGYSYNRNGHSMVAWQWATGTSFSNDASSTSVGTIDSAGSVNTTAGISIISYTGTGTAGTFAHGLNAVPKMMILKRNDGNGWSWIVYHVSMGNTKRTVLNNTGAAETVDYFQDTSPTSTVFSIKTNGNVNASGGSYIAYFFAEKQGFSKFGSYVGNNSTNGTFVYTGFKPAFVMAKRTDGGTEGWSIFDNKRSTSGANLIDDFLVPNDNVAEVSQNVCDFVSNGFKFRHVDGKYHNNGGTYMYMAFAENPFVTSESIPATAR